MQRSRWIFRLLVSSAVCVTGCVVGVAAAVAAAPPGVVTGPAANVGYTSATVTGDVNPNGSGTTWYFQYGPSTAYGLKSAASSAGSGTANTPVSVSVALAGLQPGGLYHYRLVALNPSGTSSGADATFKTPISPPGVATAVPKGVRDTSATLVATIDPHGLATIASFQYGTSPAYGSNTAARNVGNGTVGSSISIGVSHLVRNTTYHVRAIAANAAGSSAASDVTFTTSGPPIVITGSPGLVAASTATLNGTVNAGGHSSTWYFQYGLTTSYGSKTPTRTVAALSSPVAVSAAVVGLNPGTLYHVRLVAHNVDGTVTGSDVGIATLGPTLSLSAQTIVFGRSVTLIGSIPTGAANNTVTIFAQRVSDPSFVAKTAVLTGATGSWSFTARAEIQTTYKAIWNAVATPMVTVEVRPSVGLRVRSGGRFAAYAHVAHGLSHRLIRLQRLRDGVWRTISAKRLNRNSSVVFRPTLPSGVSRLRALITGFQAGSGYLAGFSPTRVFVHP